jgi:hypothetical protein
MKTTIKLSQTIANEIVYSHEINLTLNGDQTFGQCIGGLAHRFYKMIAITKMNGQGKGLDLRTPFDFEFAIDGQTLVNTTTFDETIKAKIRIGCTKKAQMRFGKLIAIAMYNQLGDELIEQPLYDLLDERNTADADAVMVEVRRLLDIPLVDIA